MQSAHHTFAADSASTLLEWLEIQATAQIPESSDYAYMAGYQNAFKVILGLITHKD
tara:strand:+ start:6007 stop:6174 length:168 start_codon:yes stop_codon:yes gene_type:complete